MKKRVLAGLLMSVMVLASAMSVSATSKEEKVEPNGSAVGKYVVTEGTSEFAKKDTEDQAKHDAAIAIVKDINAGKADVKITDAVDKDIKGKKLVQSFFDLDVVAGSDHSNCTEHHTVTLTVAQMTKGWKNIVVVHYSQDRQVWETIKVDKVDYDAKTITFNIKDLSPLAIYADVVEGGAAGTSPSTQGVSSTWMLYAAMALIVLGSGVVVSQKKRG